MVYCHIINPENNLRVVFKPLKACVTKSKLIPLTA